MRVVPMIRGLLCVVIALAAVGVTQAAPSEEPSSSHGTLNTAALRKLHFKQAQPPGCKKGDEEGGGKGRWCEIMSDGGITIRNLERLLEAGPYNGPSLSLRSQPEHLRGTT